VQASEGMNKLQVACKLSGTQRECTSAMTAGQVTPVQRITDRGNRPSSSKVGRPAVMACAARPDLICESHLLHNLSADSWQTSLLDKNTMGHHVCLSTASVLTLCSLVWHPHHAACIKSTAATAVYARNLTLSFSMLKECFTMM
jgi:hypothetical protein